MEGMAHFVCTIHGIIRIYLDNILVYVHNIMKRNVLMELLFVQYCTLIIICDIYSMFVYNIMYRFTNYMLRTYVHRYITHYCTVSVNVLKCVNGVPVFESIYIRFSCPGGLCRHCCV